MLDSKRVPHSDCLPPTAPHQARFQMISHLNLSIPTIQNVNEEFKNLSTSSALSSTSASPRFHFTPIGLTPTRYPMPNMFSSPRPLSFPAASAHRNAAFKLQEQEALDQSFFQAFNLEQNHSMSDKNLDSIGKDCLPKDKEDPNLIDMGHPPMSTDLLSANVFELFDPLKESYRPHSWPAKLDQAGTTTSVITPPFASPMNETAVTTPTVPFRQSSSSSYPYPIRLRLILTIFPEIKPFSKMVQKIRHNTQSEQVIKDQP